LAIGRLHKMSTKAFLKFFTYVLFTITFGAFLVFTAVRLYILFYDVRERGWTPSLNSALSTTLGFVFGLIYLRSLLSAKQELETARTLFSSARTPTELDLYTNRALFVLQFLGFSGLYIGLLFISNNAFLSSLLMCLIAAVDFRTRYFINRNIKTVFSDEAYDSQLDEPDYDLVQKRRAVAESFLFERPHLVKEAVRTVGCGIALAAATYGYLAHTASIISISYVVLICTLLTNEIVTVRWRHERNRRLVAIASQLSDSRDVVEEARQHFIAKQLGQTLRSVAESVIAGLILLAVQPNLQSIWEILEKFFRLLAGKGG
jgi:hypothetical protein